MNLIWYVDMPYTTDSFNSILSREEVKGIMVCVAVTKDDKIVVVSVPRDNMYLEQITYIQAKNETVVLLNDVLEYFMMFKDKSIMINITGTAFTNYNEMNRYVTLISEEVNKYPKLKINVCSTNYAFITYVTPKLEGAKSGVILIPANSSYIDVDFYIFPPSLLAPVFLNQQLKNNKDVYVSISTLDELEQANYFFKDENNKISLPKNIMEQISFVTPYPDIVNKSLKGD